MGYAFNPFTGTLDIAGAATAETDPIVGAITGIVKANGAGVISAAAVDTDYLSPASSVNKLADVDTATAAPNRDEVLKWNGTNWVPAVYSATFAMTIASFDDNQTATQLIGSGTWKTTGNITFTASYNNPPPTSASINVSGTGVSWAAPLTLTTPYTSGASAENTAYPSAKDTTTTFTLTAYDGATPRTSTTTVIFNNYIYYGASTTGSSFSEANVEALTGVVSSSYTTARAINSGASQYVVLAYPATYTSIHASGFIFNSVTCPFSAAETVSITNSAGFTENYKVFASTGTNLGNSTLTVSISASLIDRLYYGKTTKTSTFLESDVEGLVNSTVSNDNTQVWTSVTTGAGEYMLFAFPTRLGIPTFYVGGFEGGFEAPETVSVTNLNGYAENYYVWRSTNSNLGATVVTTQ